MYYFKHCAAEFEAQTPYFYCCYEPLHVGVSGEQDG